MFKFIDLLSSNNFVGCENLADLLIMFLKNAPILCIYDIDLFSIIL